MNILIIAPHFPSLDYYRDTADDPTTKFLYDYAVEWIKQGHEVVVLHTPPLYPWLFNHIAAATNYIPVARKWQLARFAQKSISLRKNDYRHNGIHVYRRPLAKYIPHREYSQRKLLTVAAATRKLLYSLPHPSPDLVLADYLSPSLTIAMQIFQASKTPVYPVFHQTDLHYLQQHFARYQPLLLQSSAILSRSFAIADRCRNAGLDKLRYEFMFSGINPAVQLGTPRKHVWRFLYCGKLRKSKNVDLLLRAFDAVWQQQEHVELVVVGDGEYAPELKLLATSLQSQANIRFLGRLPHDTVLEHMRSADCLVMVSKETFGMVYIEAMSQGCIPIAAKGEGIDGIVKDDENGFLVELHDQDTLQSKMLSLTTQNPEYVSRISSRAIETARNMRQDTLAEQLLAKLTT